MARTGAGTLTADKGAPPSGTFAFVLRKPGIVIRPYVVRFYDGTAVARDVVHPDGMRAATLFLNKPEQARKAMRTGWLSCSNLWHKHLAPPEGLPAYPGSEMPQGRSTGFFAPPKAHPEPQGEAGTRDGPEGGDEVLEAPAAAPAASDGEAEASPAEPAETESPARRRVRRDDPRREWTWTTLAGMGFRSLQREAKKLEQSAAGSADALRARVADALGIDVPPEVRARIED